MMGLSILIARILALTYVAVGIGALNGRMNFARMVGEFEQSNALTYVAGFFALAFGMTLVTYHNVWVWDWPVLITVIGWMSMLKGATFIAFPQLLSAFKG